MKTKKPKVNWDKQLRCPFCKGLFILSLYPYAPLIKKIMDYKFEQGKLAGKKELISKLSEKIIKMNGMFHEDVIGAENVLRWLKSQIKEVGK